jgi:hypothetical protein
MSKRVPINILNDILLPGSVVGAYMSIYYNLFIYWVWSNLYELKKFYAIPFIVIAIIAISIIIYLLGKNYDRKLLYIISGSFLPFIIVSLFSVIMLLLLPENLRSNNIALSLVLISTFIVQIPFVLASYIIFSLLKGYCNPKLNHLIPVSILITICPMVFPLTLMPFFMFGAGFATIKPYSVSLYFIIAGLVYSLPFALYYFIKDLYKKNKPMSMLERWGMDEKMFPGNPLGLEKAESPWVKRGLVVVCVLGITYFYYFVLLAIIKIIIAMAT